MSKKLVSPDTNLGNTVCGTFKCWYVINFEKWSQGTYLNSKHGLRTLDDSLKPKSRFQSQKENFVKCTKILALCRKNGWLLQNHGLGIRNDKLCSDDSAGSNPNTLLSIWPIFARPTFSPLKGKSWLLNHMIYVRNWDKLRVYFSRFED